MKRKVALMLTSLVLCGTQVSFAAQPNAEPKPIGQVKCQPLLDLEAQVVHQLAELWISAETASTSHDDLAAQTAYHLLAQKISEAQRDGVDFNALARRLAELRQEQHEVSGAEKTRSASVREAEAYLLPWSIDRRISTFRPLAYHPSLTAFVRSSNSALMKSEGANWFELVSTTDGSSMVFGSSHPQDAHQDVIMSADFNSDGSQLVTMSHDGEIKVWEVRTQRLLKTLKGKGSNPYLEAKFGPDGQKIFAISGHETLTIWDWTKAKVERELEHKSAQYGPGLINFQVNTSGTCLLSVFGNRVNLWDLTVEQPPFVFPVPNEDLLSVKFGPNDKTATSLSKKRNWRIWDLQTRKERTMGDDSATISMLSYSPALPLGIMQLNDGQPEAFNTTNGQVLPDWKFPDPTDQQITGLEFDPQSSILFVISKKVTGFLSHHRGNFGRISVLNARSGELLSDVQGLPGDVTARIGSDGSTALLYSLSRNEVIVLKRIQQ